MPCIAESTLTTLAFFTWLERRVQLASTLWPCNTECSCRFLAVNDWCVSLRLPRMVPTSVVYFLPNCLAKLRLVKKVVHGDCVPFVNKWFHQPQYDMFTKLNSTALIIKILAKIGRHIHDVLLLSISLHPELDAKLTRLVWHVLGKRTLGLCR